jgi:hypothetical protein
MPASVLSGDRCVIWPGVWRCDTISDNTRWACCLAIFIGLFYIISSNRVLHTRRSYGCCDDFYRAILIRLGNYWQIKLGLSSVPNLGSSITRSIPWWCDHIRIIRANNLQLKFFLSNQFMKPYYCVIGAFISNFDSKTVYSLNYI